MKGVDALVADAVATNLVSALQALGYSVTISTPDPVRVPLIEAPRISKVQQAVCERLDVSLDQLLSPRRDAKITRPRHLAMWLSRECTRASLPMIGRAFNRDHTSVIHACRTVENRWRICDEGFRHLSDEMREQFRPVIPISQLIHSPNPESMVTVAP